MTEQVSELDKHIKGRVGSCWNCERPAMTRFGNRYICEMCEPAFVREVVLPQTEQRGQLAKFTPHEYGTKPRRPNMGSPLI